MIELRFNAIKPNGQPITGTMTSPTFSEGKKKIKAIAEKNQLKLKTIEKKSTFLYKVKRGNEKPVRGEQKAFTKAEVNSALQKLGYQVLSVNKKLLDFSLKPPQQEVVSFVKLSADLLEQKLPFSEILTLLMNDLENKTMRDTLKQINNELKKGADSEAVFKKYEGVFGKFTAYMLGLASKSGNMAEIYRATAKFLDRQLEFKKNMRSALITPLITVFVIINCSTFLCGLYFS
ncbi:MAG: type II secretion system F family protein [Melioribacteraceae bacterium]|nr:type II secretion system F family protein [Melioribacteraceae bacterium]